MRKLLGFIVAVLVAVPSVAGAVPVQLDNKGVGLNYIMPPVEGAWQVNSLSDANSEQHSFTDFSEITDIDFGGDGLYVFAVHNNGETLARYTLGESYSFSGTVTKDQEINLPNTFSSSNFPGYVYLDTNGDSLFYMNRNGMIYSASMTSAWDLTTLQYTGNSFDVSENSGATTISTRGVTFNDTFTKFYTTDGNTSVYEYNINGQDVTTISYLQNQSLSQMTGYNYGIDLKPNGKELYVIQGANPKAIAQFSLGTANDVKSSTFSDSFYPTTTTAINDGEWVKQNGSSFIVGDDNSNGYIFPIQ